MNLDIVIPTYNRASLLEITLKSLYSITPPDDLQVRVTVVDNNSKDRTPEVAKQFPVNYVFEQKAGRSSALNAGIAAAQGDLIAMIDDDEEISETWYAKIAECFRQPGIDFIGGPYQPKFEVSPPKWLVKSLRGVVGWMDFGDQPRQYGPDFEGLLLGGNVIIRRELLQRVGPYNTSIGRTGKRLMIGEDDEMLERLLKTGAHGMYIPDLFVYHWIPKTRLSKSYLRRWKFWAGVSEGIRDLQHAEQVPRILGVPRYRYGRLARAPWNALREPGVAFQEELHFWYFAGFFYGRHWMKGATS
jgi:glucosyl-dolichyl phosphate glucuronosyltransferase